MRNHRAISVLLLLCVLFYSPVSGQSPDAKPGDYTTINSVVLETRLLATISSAIVSTDTPAGILIPGLKFRPGLVVKGLLPSAVVTKRFFLQFNLCNTSDSAHAVYFCPGYYFRKIDIYRKAGFNYEPVPVEMPNIDQRTAFRLIRMAPHDSATYVVELGAIKTYNTNIRPRLIGIEHVIPFLNQISGNMRMSNRISYLFCGLLLMMILFSLTSYFQGGNREFLFYSGYAFFLGGLLFLQTSYQLYASWFGFFLEEYLDFLLQGTGTIFYVLFMKKFLNSDKEHPFLNRIYNTAIWLLTGSMILYTFLHYFGNNYTPEFLTEILTKILLLLLVVAYLVYGTRHWKNKMLRYLFWGNFFLFVFASISQLGILLDAAFKNLPGILSSTVVYYEIGLFLELVFFLAALNYKNRQKLILETREKESLKAQNLLKEYEKEIAVYKAQQEERQRISADMHDELGAGMTAIRLMSEIARNKMKENTPVEIEKISRSADDVLNKMNAIIWSMNSGNDTLDNLISYIRSYALEYFDNTETECKVRVNDSIPDKEISGDKRRNIFLCVKEILNNTLKHAGASTLIIDIKTGDTLRITIKDNGKGIELDKLRQFGNGVKNMMRRMETIGGTCKIENKNGTITTLELPL